MASRAAQQKEADAKELKKYLVAACKLAVIKFFENYEPGGGSGGGSVMRNRLLALAPVAHVADRLSGLPAEVNSKLLSLVPSSVVDLHTLLVARDQLLVLVKFLLTIRRYYLVPKKLDQVVNGPATIVSKAGNVVSALERDFGAFLIHVFILAYELYVLSTNPFLNPSVADHTLPYNGTTKATFCVNQTLRPLKSTLNGEASSSRKSGFSRKVLRDI